MRAGPAVRTICCLLFVLASPPASAEDRCLDLDWKGPRGELCLEPAGKPAGSYRLLMKPPGSKKPVEFLVKLEEGEKLLFDRFDTLDLKDEVLVWLPISRGFEGHTLILVYRIKTARWEKLPVRWMCQRPCTQQHVSYQTTLSGGPPDTRIFYETTVSGQHLKSTYQWDGKRLTPVEIEEPRNQDALSRGFKAPALTPVCRRSSQVRDAISKRLKLPCEKIGIDQLTRITRLGLSRKDIRKIKAGDFSGLSELASLDLSHNPLKKLPPGVFDGLFKLRSLNFQGCKLKTVPGGVFKHLGSLKDLYLNHNQLRVLPENAFQGLSALTFLSLNHNQLKTPLPPGVLKPLKKRCNVYLSNNRAAPERE